jgi:hypothetical protein
MHTSNCKTKALRMHRVECTNAHHETQVLYAMWDYVFGVLSPLEIETTTTCNKFESYCNFFTQVLVG